MEIYCKAGHLPAWTYKDKAIHRDGYCYDLCECELMDFYFINEGTAIVINYRGNELKFFYGPNNENVLEHIEKYASISDNYIKNKSERLQKRLQQIAEAEKQEKIRKVVLKISLWVLLPIIALSIFGNYKTKMFALSILIVLFTLVLVVIVAICIIHAIKNRETPEERERMRQARIQAEANKRVQDMLAGKPNPELVKMQQKKETEEIIKGAVAGGIIAGDAGAVVGAMIAKNKIDNEKKQQ